MSLIADPQGGLAPGRRGATQWAAAIREVLERGQCFLAYDMTREALGDHPEDLKLRVLMALALFRSGAVEEGRKALAPLDDRLETVETRLGRAWDAFQRTTSIALEHRSTVDFQAKAALLELAHSLSRLEHADEAEGTRDRETTDLLVALYTESYLRLGRTDDLRRGCRLRLDEYRQTSDFISGATAAAMTWLLGEQAQARDLATQLLHEGPLATLTDTQEQAFLRRARAGALALILDEPELAVEYYHAATTVAEGRYPLILSERNRAQRLADHGLTVPPEVFEVLKPPAMVIFAGQPIDAPDQEPAIFPSAAEEAVHHAIGEWIDRLGAQIGYCSANAGADILFIESMLERGMEVHVLLPFALDDFLAARVRYAGPRWERRFRNALKLVSTVTFVTNDNYLGDDVFFRHANSVIEGTARLRASILGTTPHLLLVWDYGLAAELGSAADFMDCWSDPARLHVIDLNNLRGKLSPAALAAPPPAGSQCLVPPPVYPEMPQRSVHAMLFADVVGFSKLKDEHLPVFWDFMAQLRDDIDGCHQPLTLIESWGDALYVVMDTASAMAEYAFVLMEAIETIDTVAMGLPVQLRLRVGLHAGPVFNGLHPLTGRPIVYGGHVNRAARIEPVTLPGQIYASEQFVALLTAEESAAAAEARLMGDSCESGYVCEYLGILALAKQFGEQAVYHLRKALAYCPTPVVPDY